MHSGIQFGKDGILPRKLGFSRVCLVSVLCSVSLICRMPTPNFNRDVKFGSIEAFARTRTD